MSETKFHTHTKLQTEVAYRQTASDISLIHNSTFTEKLNRNSTDVSEEHVASIFKVED
jgi:hypothetical protein